VAISTPNQYRVLLSVEQRTTFSEIVKHKQSGARKIQHAQVLLLSDHNRDDGAMSRSEIAKILDIHVNSVDRIRKRFVVEGAEPALNRKARLEPPVPPILDGRAEAVLIAICCSSAPKGRTRWTMQMLADQLVARKVVTQISAETVRRNLKKTNYNHGEKIVGAFPKTTIRGSSRKWKTFSMSTRANIPKKSR
jgi:transposase